MSQFQVKRQHIATKSGRFETCYASSSSSLNHELPTLVLINSYATSVDLYAPQFVDKELTEKCNLLAIGLLGHEVEAKVLGREDSFTFWDQADLVIEVLDTLGVEKFFLLGTSQGGFIACRVAIRAGSRVKGILACGSTFTSEVSYNQYFQDLCDAFGTEDPSFVVPESYQKWFIHMGWGSEVDPSLEAFWRKSVDDRYSGLEGERRLWQVTTNLLERDTIRNRLRDIRCPFWILHGTEDVAISVALIESQQEWITRSKDKQIHFVQGGTHYLTQSNPEEVKRFIVKMLESHA